MTHCELLLQLLRSDFLKYIYDYFSKGRQEELQCILTALSTLNQHTNYCRTPSRIFHQLRNAKIPLDLLYVN